MEYETRKKLTVKKKSRGPKIDSISATKTYIADLVQLDQVEEPTIIHLLRKRYERDEFYTAVGDILISVNPFKRTKHFTPKEMSQYRGRGGKVMPPHPYLIVDNAYNQVMNTGKLACVAECTPRVS